MKTADCLALCIVRVEPIGIHCSFRPSIANAAPTPLTSWICRGSVSGVMIDFIGSIGLKKTILKALRVVSSIGPPAEKA